MRPKPSGKERAVEVDGRLLKSVRKMARYHADRDIQTNEASLRPFWDQWEDEICRLQIKIDPLVKKVYDYANSPLPRPDRNPQPPAL